jgi:hypothetical protein
MNHMRLTGRNIRAAYREICNAVLAQEATPEVLPDDVGEWERIREQLYKAKSLLEGAQIGLTRLQGIPQEWKSSIS